MVSGCLAVEPASCPAVGNGIPSNRYGRVTVVSKSRYPQSNVRRGGRSSALCLTCVVTRRPVIKGAVVKVSSQALFPTCVRDNRRRCRDGHCGGQSEGRRG
jgi:hypothetical protein